MLSADHSLIFEFDGDDAVIDNDESFHAMKTTMDNIPVGANQQLFQRTTYMVPSQLSYEEFPVDNISNKNDNPWPTKMSSVPPQGKDAYNDFKHLYESVCKLTDAAGTAGRECLMEGLNDIRGKTIDILGGATSSTGMGTLPKSTNKKVDHRKKMITSPQK